MLNAISYSLPAKLGDAVRNESDVWRSDEKIAQIWQRNASVWTGDDEAKWLGWLDIVDTEIRGLDAYRSFAKNIKTDGFNDVLLMGMGGSSLCPEVLAITFGKTNFHILDSTVPAQVKAVGG
jgi:glucose-6-phosphate isomerase